MSSTVIGAGPYLINFPDLSTAFARAREGFGGDLPEPPRVWNASDYFTPVLHFLDKFLI